MLIIDFRVLAKDSTFYGPVENELAKNVEPSSGFLMIRRAIVTIHEGQILIAGYYGIEKEDAKQDHGSLLQRCKHCNAPIRHNGSLWVTEEKIGGTIFPQYCKEMSDQKHEPIR